MTNTADLDTPRYPVRLVALRTGLSPHLLRAWERRYGVVTPTRSEGGQRLYSELDIERLRRLGRLSARGHSIGQIASLGLDQLTKLDEETAAEAAAVPLPPEPGLGSAGVPVDSERVHELTMSALRAVREFAPRELDAILERAAVTLGVPAFVDQVAAPVLRAIGHGWTVRSVSVAQEHMATAVIRRLLGWLLGMYQPGPDAPRLVVATPPGEVHEMGALMMAVSAAAEGWSVTYLGSDLPVPDLLAAARQIGAHAVALSFVYQANPLTGPAVLREVRAGLPPDVVLLAGGAGAGRLRAEAEELDAAVLESLPEARAALRRLALDRSG